MNEWSFQLGQNVKIGRQEQGDLVGRAEYLGDGNNYLVSYVDPKAGILKRDWFNEVDLLTLNPQ